MPAGRTVFKNNSRHCRFHLPYEIQRSLHVLPQSFPQTFRPVTAKADGIVIIHLHIAKAIFLQCTNHFFRQIFLYPGLTHIPEAAHRCGQRLSVPFQQMRRLLICLRLTAYVINLKPNTRLHTVFPDQICCLLQSVGKQLV